MVKCTYCKQVVEPGTGISEVSPTGKLSNFCKSKCVKSAKMKRNPRKITWIRKSKKTAKK